MMNEIQSKIIIKIIDKMKSLTPCDILSPVSVDDFRFLYSKYSKEKRKIIRIKSEKSLKGIFHSGLFFIYLNDEKITQIGDSEPFYNEIDSIIKSIVLKELDKCETERLKKILQDLENE